MKNIFLMGGLMLIMVSSCNNRKRMITDHNKIDIFVLDSFKSVILDSSLNELKSLNLEYNNDSLTVSSIYLKRTYVNDYFFKENMLVDYRSKLLGGVDTIPFLTKNDTAFVYDEYKDGAYVPFLFGLNKQAAEYTITKKKNIYIRTLHSLYAPSYYEKYYYDDNFHIIRFEYSYKGNKFVYTKKSIENIP
ncbi:hypothetical protein SAMN05444405_10612 [Bacteroides luti]|uniref:Uncharacterized protein n=1 Tax=Bacteroides luti TaxID=1297750 RepID=A0A1M4ZPG6_9BACE|nr:hypothetical protein [Bacteroides luti]SHF19933.1 hypothetical protein SAMN05444405_10612 [Bacteroides luti]